MTPSRLPALALLALLAAAAAARGEQPMDERTCLREYVMARSDPARGRRILEDCAAAHPTSFAILRTLGRLLARSEGSAADRDAARRHLAAAAALDPAQFADDWTLLAELDEEAGDLRAAGEAWSSALTFLPVPDRLETLDRLWHLWNEAGDSERAVAVWSEVWHRHEDDFEFNVTAGRLLRAAGRIEDAKASFERAAALRPDDPEVRAAVQQLLVGAATAGTAADQRALLETWRPRLREADDPLLDTLLAASRGLDLADATEDVAREMLRRRPDHAAANLAVAEQAAASGRADVAVRHAERALAGGDLAGEDRGRAHEIVALATLEAAHARYASAGASATAELVSSTAAAYRRALGRLEAASAAGRDVSGSIARARQALATLGGLQAEIADVRVVASQEGCRALSREARLRYEQDRPLTRMARRDLRLSRSPGGAADLAALPAGSSVRLSDASLAGGGCWIEVRTADGTRGWAPADAFDG